MESRMSRIQDGIRNIKSSQASEEKSKKAKNVRERTVVSPLTATLPISIGDLPKEQQTYLEPGKLVESRILNENAAPELAAPYKMLRTRVLQKMDRSGWRTLAVTASHESAGKTMTAINLAITIAKSSGRFVYLLDLDLRKPGIARALGLNDVETGIGDYLSGDAKLDEILWSIGIDNLFVVPGVGRFDNSSELLTSRPMSELVEAIRGIPSGPIVIVDLPPALAADDALSIVPIVDSLLFVVAESETKRAEITHSLEILKDVSLLGVVLNKSKDPHPGY